MIIALICVLCCAFSLIFLSMTVVDTTVVKPYVYNYTTVAVFDLNVTQNASELVQNTANYNNWGSNPGSFDGTSSMRVGINSYTSSPADGVSWVDT